MVETFGTLRAANLARQAEWDRDSRITLSYRANELAGETGEACNVAKKLERERLGIAGSRATVGQLGEELADVVICADLVALLEGIDLEAAVTAKFNATSEKSGLQTRLSLESDLRARLAWAETEVIRLRALINAPETGDFFEGVRLEAAHQVERWGVEHDTGKGWPDWFWLLGWLAGKVVHSLGLGDREKARHHCISSAAVLLNWFRAIAGTETAMRPGIAPPGGDQ